MPSHKDIDVSIIIPCYNSERFVAKAIESALRQNTRLCEVIVINDGSTDNSSNIINSFGPKIKTYHIDNHGVSYARNFGLSKSQCKYIKFLDSDDYLAESCIDKQYKMASLSDNRNIYCGYMTCFIDDGQFERSFTEKYRRIDNLIDRSDLLSQPLHVSLPLFKRETLLEVGGFNVNLKRFEDYDLCVRLSANKSVFCYDDVNCIFHREYFSDDRLSKKPLDCTAHQILDMFKSIELMLNVSDPGMTDGEKVHLARHVWGRGRDLARAGFSDHSQNYFDYAYQLSGNRAVKGSSLYRLLYALWGNKCAERVIDFLKKNGPRSLE